MCIGVKMNRTLPRGHYECSKACDSVECKAFSVSLQDGTCRVFQEGCQSFSRRVQWVTYKNNRPENYSHENRFELFGVDILVDSKGWPWLLEVQMGPSLIQNDESTKKLYPAVIQSAFELGGVTRSVDDKVALKIVWEE